MSSPSSLSFLLLLLLYSTTLPIQDGKKNTGKEENELGTKRKNGESLCRRSGGLKERCEDKAKEREEKEGGGQEERRN